ncbi:MAG: hypothetical protein HYS15_00365 [Candidatus Spechtbacteria bacterium]|nr:hypothetical protein [Candidatus Spechtbacteria bacterium]
MRMSWLRLEKFTFFVLLFSIPFQKRNFLFGPGLPQTTEFFEWGSAFLYFTDFLILLLFGFWIWGFRSKMKKGEVAENSTPPVAPPFAGGGFRGGMHVMLLLFLGFALISLIQAELMNVGVYRFLKLTEFVLLFFYIANRVPKIGVKPILVAFVASGAFQSVIAILQFMKQSSLGLEVFHESTLAIGMKGVAHIAADGVSLIRAYGTFPSPNVLAGFLGVCLLVLFCLFVSSGQKNQNLKRTGDYYNVRSYVMLICIFLLSLGLILTFSRGVIIFFACTSAVFFAGIFLAEKLQYYKKRAIQVAGFVLVSWSVILAAAWPEVSTRFLESSASEPAIQEHSSYLWRSL